MSEPGQFDSPKYWVHAGKNALNPNMDALPSKIQRGELFGMNPAVALQKGTPLLITSVGGAYREVGNILNGDEANYKIGLCPQTRPQIDNPEGKWIDAKAKNSC
ncbi:MAG: hypothetical protein CM15mP9_1290 [Methanobacteriota archaeon]|nr:MAG: hypothetical protein CM15mP9_1290 [Euryarchaeota archaeon]